MKIQKMMIKRSKKLLMLKRKEYLLKKCLQESYEKAWKEIVDFANFN